MYFGPSRAEVDKLKAMYPKGTVVELVYMNDYLSPPQGTLGTVLDVDDIGQIRVHWDTGKIVRLNPFEDVFKVIS